ncbi:MAG: PAS domain S-box protein [Chloroflexi bacterium]|nr:PAS domain S-box protein [Chloroflexota bacterium]
MRKQKNIPHVHQRLAAIVESSDDAIIGKTLDGIITDWNPGAERLYGYSAEEAIDHPISMLCLEHHTEDISDILDKVKQGKRVAHYETIRVKKNGEQIHVSLTVSPILDTKNHIIGASTIARNITRHKQITEALAESEERYRSLFENASDGIIVCDLDGDIIMINQAMANLIGDKIHKVKGMNIAQFPSLVSFQSPVARQRGLLTSESKDTVDRQELRITHKDGTERIVETVTSVMHFGGGMPVIQFILRDVTEQRMAHELMRTYADRITQAQEDERKRISQELHDDTIQGLANLGMEIDTLISVNQKPSNGISAKQIEELRTKTEILLEGIRRITQGLRPPMLGEFGLVFALQWLVDNTKAQTGMETYLKILGNERRALPETETILFRITQEALHNVVKHSEATKTKIQLEFAPRKTTLSISDNGQGFEVPETIGMLAWSGKLGLVGMQERVRFLDGKFTLKSGADKGTTVTVELKE